MLKRCLVSGRILFALLLLQQILAPTAPQVAIKREGQKVVAKDVRFTVISPSLIRLEYSPEGKFVDEPSILVRDRDWGKVDYQLSEEKGWLIIKTKMFTLRYRLGSGSFNKENLSISWKLGDKVMSWRPGDQDLQNLGGTVASLDGVSRDNLPSFPQGILSRSGYFFLDDTPHPLWDTKEEWWKPRPQTSQQDWYFFCYGHNYPLALDEYTRLTGRIPMLPRYAFGAWYSRYWPYSDLEEREIINTFRQKRIPLDVLVIDVDWHLYGWESYDWNPQYFPRPEEFIDWCHKRGIKVTLNTHPGTPIPSADSHFRAFCEALGVSPEGKDSVSYNLANKRDALAFGDILLGSVLRQGVDFLWIDGAGASAPGIDHFAWTNKVYYETEERIKGNRALIFGRQGLVGSGTHRYPVGFSGDTYSQWEVLRYEIPFTVKGGNVGIYWSHDIGGFMGDKLPDELYVRWVQFGAFSPILRLHSNHGRRLPWDYSPEAERIVKKYFQIRYSLFPYIYSVSREVHETGVPLCRGLYIHYPELDEAYKYEYEYMFGPNLLVAPIDQPAKDGVATKEVYLPPGIWYDFFSNKVYKGPRTLIYRGSLEDMPVFAKAGSIIPMQPEMQFICEKPIDPLILNIYPGAKGEFTLYEDDGLSFDYRAGKFAKTKISFQENGRNLSVIIGATQGSYEGQLENRSYLLVINGVSIPVTVKIDGKNLSQRKSYEELEQGGWFYDSDHLKLYIRTPSFFIRKNVKIEVALSKPTNEIVGLFGEIEDLAQKIANLEEKQTSLSLRSLGYLNKLDELNKSAREKFRSGNYDGANADVQKSREVLNRFLQSLWSEKESRERDELLQETLGISLVTTRIGYKLRFSLLLPADIDIPKSVKVRLDTEVGWKCIGKREYDFTGKELKTISGEFESKWEGEKIPLGGVVGTIRAELLFPSGKSLSLEKKWEIDCSYLQAFRLFGIYDNRDNRGMSQSYPPEEWMKSGIPSRLEGVEEKRTRLVQLSLDENGAVPIYINLLDYFGKQNNVVAYAFTYIYSPEDVDGQILLGSDDGCILWVNGEKVFAYLEPRVARPDENKVPVHLRKGWNEVVLKVGQLGGDWGFYLRVLGKDGKPLPGGLNWYEPM
ncbi:DUF5110 domain-containing protein [bacterium]|nr:DUF5110 domain-containing protein [bacterium]